MMAAAFCYWFADGVWPEIEDIAGALVVFSSMAMIIIDSRLYNQ